MHRPAYHGILRNDMELSEQALDHFGEILIKRVRAEAILDWTKILDGRMKGVRAERLRPELSGLDPGQMALIQRLLPQVVDTVLHHLLWTLEQEESIDVAVRTAEGLVPSLREVSDGLAGELYGWIPRFGEADDHTEH